MDGVQLVKSERLQMAGALAYATAVIAAFIWLRAERLAAPLVLVALGIPLIFRLVPRNYLYGMRTARTLWGDEATWYRQNVITGIACVVAGVIWLIVQALG
jgi:hypothetical protein